MRFQNPFRDLKNSLITKNSAALEIQDNTCWQNNAQTLDVIARWAIKVAQRPGSVASYVPTNCAWSSEVGSGG